MSVDQPTQLSTRAQLPWSAYVAAGLTILAPALGGSTELWAQATICLGCGLLMLIAPPRRSLGLLPNLVVAALLLLALTAFLPAKWFPPDDVRTTFSQFGIALPDTHSPQPWLSFQAACFLLLGLAWAYYLFASDWKMDLRNRAWLVYAAGILLLAATLAVASALKTHVPFWPNVREFGFFPNRNQTSDVLALGGILIYGIMLQAFRLGKRTSWLWLASLALICWALIVNFSRSGIILFFGGAFVCHLAWLKTSKWRYRSLLALGGLTIILALFFAVGGETLGRFGRETADFFYPSRNARLAIQYDGLVFSAKSPLTGVGLGNFASLFSMHRKASFARNLAIHPESDWIWAATEMGWLAPALLAVLFLWWIKQTMPFQPGTARLMRIAALTCGCAFVVHGMFDVSGHRMGALWPALFLAATAIHPAANFRASLATGATFRIIGVALIAISAWWFSSIVGTKTWPTTAELNRIKSQIEQAITHNDYSSVRDLAAKGLKIAPLDWLLYFKRASAEAALLYSNSEARRDFHAAEYLLPQWPESYFEEGRVWLAAGEADLAFAAWAEALRRSPDRAPAHYIQMFDLVQPSVSLLARWRDLGRTNKELLLIFLQNAGAFEFSLELDRLLLEDRQSNNDRRAGELPQLRSFSPAELGALFSAWYNKSDKARLAETLEQNPEWQKIGWRELARIYAEREDYRRACETAWRFGPGAPELPRTARPGEPVETLKARFLLNRTNLDVGLALYFAQIREGQVDNALATVRELAALPNSPKYLRYAEARLWAQKEQWKEAWEALARFEFGTT